MERAVRVVYCPLTLPSTKLLISSTIFASLSSDGMVRLGVSAVEDLTPEKRNDNEIYGYSEKTKHFG